VDDFNKPNGLAFSPDESVLYVADTDEHLLRAFDVAEDGSLSGDRVFYRVEPPGELRPDGLKVDVYGNVYIAASDGVQIVSPEGELQETIELPERPANLAFGGPDGRTLYVTGRTSVYAVGVRYQGAVYRRRFAPLSP
jgi:gluconolactonase